MKHFSEARREAKEAVCQNKSLLEGVSCVCLIWDIKGILRALLKIDKKGDIKKAKTIVSGILQNAAGPFWKHEIWVWSDKWSSPAERAVYREAWKHALTIETGPPEIKILDRRISKSSWFNPVLGEPWPLNEHTPPILSFYSFKGGVGRTTALASLAIQLARSGKKVAAIDLDLEAPGLSSLLPGAEGRVAEYGVIDYLLERCILGSRKDLDIADYYHLVDDPRVVSGGPPITVVPAGKLDHDYLEKLSRVDYESLVRPLEPGKSSPAPLNELLEQLKSQRQIDYFLLDSRAGFHDLGGLALSGISHLDIIFGLDSEQSWRGMELVVRFLGQDRIWADQRQLLCAFVFALAPSAGSAFRDEAFPRFLDKAYDLFVDCFYYPQGSAPEDGWDVPAIEDSTQPHYPIALDFDARMQQARRIEEIADTLCQNEFKGFGELVLERVGRALS